MAKRIKLEMTLGTGFTFGLRRALNKLKATVDERGLEVFGPDFADLVNNPVAIKPGTLGRASSTAPVLSQNRLARIYQKAWRKRYAEIRNRMSAAGFGAPEWAQWKKRNLGKNPYTGDQTISYTNVGQMTGYLYSSVEDAFQNGTNDHVTIGNLLMVGGFRFRPSSYPRRASPFRGHDKETLSRKSYVIIFLDMLHSAGVLEGTRTEGESLLDFSRQSWEEIALAMTRIIRDQFKDPLEKELVTELKVVIE